MIRSDLTAVIVALLFVSANAVWTRAARAQAYDCANQTVLPEGQAQCEYLVKFYEATGGDNWTSNSGWLTDPDVCNWEGVGCSGPFLKSLVLASHNLVGTIPNGISALELLELLNLGGNQLTGDIPGDIGRMGNLETVYLNDNQFTNRFDGGFLLTFVNHLMRTFDVSNNRLTGTLYWAPFDRLDDMERMDLSGNQLSGSIPETIAELPFSLQRLDLSNNRFGGTLPVAVAAFGDHMQQPRASCDFRGNFLYVPDTPEMRAALGNRRDEVCGVPLVPPDSNLARGGVANQSSIAYDGWPELANDGNTNGHYTWPTRSVSHTKHENEAWWIVDLGAQYRIDEIVVFNRTDCCADRLSGFQVLIGTQFDAFGSTRLRPSEDGVSVHPSSRPVAVENRIFPNRVGRFVQVQLPNSDFLSLAEVQVFGSLHEGGNQPPLLGPLPDQIDYIGREVSIALAAEDPDGDTIRYEALGLPPGLSINSESGLITGRIEGPADTYEVELRAYDTVDTTRQSNSWVVEDASTTTVNAALGGSAFASSELHVYPTYPDARPANAIDGNRDGRLIAGQSVASTLIQPDPYWQLDLRAEFFIEKIVIWNKTDKATDRLHNYHVLVSSEQFEMGTLLRPNSVYWLSLIEDVQAVPSVNDYFVAGGSGDSDEIDVARVGRYVRVQITGVEQLGLAEVEVFGRFYDDANRPPVLKTVSDQLVIAESDVAVKLEVFEPEGETVALSADGLPPGMVLDGATGIISGRVDVASIGEYSVQLHASDGAATTTQSMKWNVVDGVSTTRNLTPLAALSQSSVRYDADAYRAADGLLGSYFVESYGVQYSRGATHTASEQNAWWEADLAEVMHVQEIVVWNRADCCRDRLNDFHVLLSRDPFVTRDLDSTLAQPGVLDLHRPNAAELRNHFDVGEDARFVRVQLSEKNFLNLGEVEILGRNVAPGQRYAYAEKAAPVGQEVTVLSLEAPYPNPFANAVSIDYTLERQQRVTVSIYNALGQMVSVLQDGEAEGGRHRLSWNGLDATGRSVADGVYFVVLQTEREGLNRSIAKVR